MIFELIIVIMMARVVLCLNLCCLSWLKLIELEII